jgi:hypothetical protein
MEAKNSTGSPVFVYSEDEIEQMIKRKAYYIALSRGFYPGFELDDWLAAEKEVYKMLNRIYDPLDTR